MKLKKPRFWDYQKPNFLSNLLYPFSKIYELVFSLKNANKKKIENIKTICVGNIYLGGTGKTSLSIELKKILDEEKIKACFVKKYYSDQIDEQKLLNKFGKTFIDKSRLCALEKAALEKFEVAIFDDGLQDKNINYDLSFVCFNKKNMYGNGRVIPSGPLRESLDSLKNYKNVFLSGNANKLSLTNTLFSNYNNLNYYESFYQPKNLDKFNLNDSYLIFSGIGNHSTFVEMLLFNKFNIVHDLEFPDHYSYSSKDIKEIFDLAQKKNAKILTTEKDYLRLDENNKKNIEYIEIDLKIIQLEEIKRKISFIK